MITPHELVIDNFAGGGGASTGIEAALGRPVDIAINHSPHAIAMHTVNHPETRHFCESIWEVDPREACGSRPVGLAWFSPDCTHFSKAKGGKPRSKEIRGLAWVVIRWASEVAPRIIVLENVEEFQTWGPLDDDGKPIAAQAGDTFREWLSELSGLGYTVEFRTLVAADYGAPTTRKRLFLVARRDGQGIVWPSPTHGRGLSRPWRSAAEIIDWSLPCPSIFERQRPLADATLRRIAAGVSRYVLDAETPFIAPSSGSDIIAPSLIQTGYGERPGQAPRSLDIGRPLGTVVAGGAKHALVAALVTKHYGGVVGHGVGRPLGTITTKDHHSVTAAFLTASKQRGGCRLAQVRLLLERHLGQADHQAGLFDLVETRPNEGLVTIAGETYAIADVGMRMLQPRELFAAQGFPSDYIIDFEVDGKAVTKGAQIALAGNSVPPPVAREIIRANTRQAMKEAA